MRDRLKITKTEVSPRHLVDMAEQESPLLKNRRLAVDYERIMDKVKVRD